MGKISAFKPAWTFPMDICHNHLSVYYFADFFYIVPKRWPICRLTGYILMYADVRDMCCVGRHVIDMKTHREIESFVEKLQIEPT